MNYIDLQGKLLRWQKGDCHHPPGFAKFSNAKSSLHCLSTIALMALATDSSWRLFGELHYVGWCGQQEYTKFSGQRISKNLYLPVN